MYLYLDGKSEVKVKSADRPDGLGFEGRLAAVPELGREVGRVDHGRGVPPAHLALARIYDLTDQPDLAAKSRARALELQE